MMGVATGKVVEVYRVKGAVKLAQLEVDGQIADFK